MDSSLVANSNLLYQLGVIKSKETCDLRQTDPEPSQTFGKCVIPKGHPKQYKLKCFSTGGGPGTKKKGNKWHQVLVASYTFGHKFRPCTCVCFVDDYDFVGNVQ